MSENFLQDKIIKELGKREICSLELDNEIIENLNPKFGLRDYQTKAFQMFKSYFENEFDFKYKPLSALFNMATGSGKTLIMAGLILYLYKHDYRNFLFFVNSANIIEKTKDNFLNFGSEKYLFDEKININGINVNISQVNNFQDSSDDEINICFTTIQKLNGDLNTEKENSITFEDFKNQKIVFIADEAHHNKKDAWKKTIADITNANPENILLEFTATPKIENDEEWGNNNGNNLLYKYDLKQFVEDKYSKIIDLFEVNGEKEYRMLLAVIINQYRQDLAHKHGLNNFKPVILFKAIRTIKESNENHQIFRDLIDNLEENKILEIKEKSKEPLFDKIFKFYADEDLSISHLIRKIQINFSENNCLNVNEKNLDNESNAKDKKISTELINQQIKLNNLEDKTNPIRAIFAVEKLNEGWDVLNLFDIVRPSDKKFGSGTKGSTTSEAQLIGRGARYYPFKLDESQDKYKRKYDHESDNDLSILEELYFYSYEEPSYISELKSALKEEGLSIKDDLESKELKLKESFKKTKLFKHGKIWINDRQKRKTYDLNSFESVKYFNEPFVHEIYSGRSKKSNALNNNEDNDKNEENSNWTSKSIGIGEIENNIIRKAMAKIRFYNFNNLKKYFPNITSSEDIISESKFLNKMIIKFKGQKIDLDNLNNKQKLDAIYRLLIEIKDKIKLSTFEFKGTKFSEKNISEIFQDKVLNIPKGSPRLNGDEDFLRDKDWYAFNANYGTEEEEACVHFLDGLINDLNQDFKEIFLVRNELHFKIYNSKNGEAFAPDFVLFMIDKDENEIKYQLFIEPKGKHLIKEDKWKEEFLKEIYLDPKLVKYDGSEDNYRVIGLPFYNKHDENKFKEIIEDKLMIN
ncbi:MAG: DEAD/DEAH box helicase family protein [Methanobrevibacter sp.]|jgi:type III restriction enzyme|nr:DEAD/DEAH box helicase family protein [Candidatus Methanoflexus mossambicus]